MQHRRKEILADYCIFPQAANFLNIQPLLNLCCKTTAGMMKGLSPEQIRQKFNIVNDFTPEEEQQILKEKQ